MHYDYLVEFVELAQSLNYTKTAEQLCISQSVLSKHIMTLEVELGVKLLNRTRRSVELTEEGRVVLEEGLQIVNKGRDIENYLNNRLVPETLTVGGIISNPKIISLLSYASKLLPGEKTIRISLGTITPISYLKAIKDGDLDLLVCYRHDDTEIDMSDICEMPLLNDPFYAVVERSHPIAGQESVALKDLRNETFIKLFGDLYHSDAGWLHIEESCSKAGFTPKTRNLMSSSIMDCLNAKLTDEVFILSYWTITGQFVLTNPTYKCVPVTDGAFPISVYWNGRTIKPLFKKYLEELKNLAEESDGQARHQRIDTDSKSR